MDRLRLESPSLARKADALEYLEEHVAFGSEINGAGGMQRCLDECTYEQWLAELERRKDEEYARGIGRVPSRTFFLVREKDRRIVGMLNLRCPLTDDDIAYGASHIGYGIRPSERQKGYNKANLYLGLEEARKLGETKVYLACGVDNVASNKTVLALGGILEKTEFNETYDTIDNFYWIDGEEALEKYSDVYGPLAVI